MLSEVSGCGAWALEGSANCVSLRYGPFLGNSETSLWSVIDRQYHRLFGRMEIGGGVHLDRGYHIRSTCSKILNVGARTWKGTEMSSWLMMIYPCSRIRRWTSQAMTSDVIFRDGDLLFPSLFP